MMSAPGLMSGCWGKEEGLLPFHNRSMHQDAARFLRVLAREGVQR